jgi:hypothetical protein
LRGPLVGIAGVFVLVACSGSVPDDVGEESTDTLTQAITLKDQIAAHFAAMEAVGEPGERAVQKSLIGLKARGGVSSKLIEMYADTEISDGDTFEKAARGRARWAIVHTLGELRDSSALSTLTDIAEDALPDPKASPDEYKSEYLVRLRAIDGLAKLGAVAPLRRLYDTKGVLSGPAAAALLEIGHAPPGIVEVEPSTVLGDADATDHHPKTDKSRVHDSRSTVKP